MGQLQLTCLGDCQVVLDGEPLTAFQTDKVRAMLIYLAIDGKAHQRSALAPFFWPGYSEKSANNSLRQSLHRLRQLLHDAKAEPPWLLITRQTVQFNPATAVQIDSVRFSNLLAACTTHQHPQLATCQPCLARLRQAVDLYHGDFLSGFTVADSDPFEEWRCILQEHLHLQALDALTHLANAAEDAGDEEGVLQVAHRQLTLEPWLEAAHRRVMRTLARRGQRAAALAQYQRCRQVLLEELRVEPEAETTTLYEQIRHSALPSVAPRRQKHRIEGENKSGTPTLPSHHNLPVQLTPLIGRTQEVAELTLRLQQPEVRLLTMVGAGGMGKTRLAIEVGRTTQATFADGVCFVGLAALNTPAALAATIATALGIPLQGGDPRNLLLQALRPKQMLLILDNFEHLLGQETAAVELVGEILTAAPAIQILVTSRERLRLRYEQIYTVQALAFAPTAIVTDAANMAAIRLFVQAAQRIQAHFQLTAVNLATVLRICRLVQGMPLGLELAVTYIDQLPLVAIADAIAQNAEFLAMDWRDLPERQRSMRAVFQWSWHLLDAQERRVFRQLAIFQGGFTQAAAEPIAGATRPMLTHLLHKSLVQDYQPNQTHGRYLIHALLRQFAAAELAAAHEETATADRHSIYYLTFLAAQQPRIMYAAPREAVQAIQDEIDNIRQAWRWGAGHLPTDLVEQSALALREFYWLTGLTDEAIEMFTLAMHARTRYLHHQHPAPVGYEPQADQQAEGRVYSILVGITAAFQLIVGRHEETFTLATEILHRAPVEYNPVGAAFGYMLQGQARRRQGQSDKAQQLLTASITLARQARSGATNPALLLDIEKRAYSWLASIALSNDDYAAARAHGIHQLEICQQFQMQVGEVIALTCLIDVDKAVGDYARAQQYAEQALATARQVSFRWGEAVCIEYLAELAWRQGDYQQAQRLYEQALALFHTMNRVLEEANVSQMLGRLWLWLGDAARAHRWIEQAFDLLQSLGAPARESFWVRSARARLHYLTDNLAQALVDAEDALAMARQVDGGASQADALVLLGLVREHLQQSAAATAAYQEALTIYKTLGHHHHTAEPRAGLARLALAAGALPSALTEIEAVLLILQSYPLAGFDEPFQIYLTCYTVLVAQRDSRAAPLLATAHELLTAYAERLLDLTVRRSFLENVASHRALQQAFVHAQTKIADQKLPIGN